MGLRYIEFGQIWADSAESGGAAGKPNQRAESLGLSIYMRYTDRRGGSGPAVTAEAAGSGCPGQRAEGGQAVTEGLIQLDPVFRITIS